MNSAKTRPSLHDQRFTCPTTSVTMFHWSVLHSHTYVDVHRDVHTTHLHGQALLKAEERALSGWEGCV